MEIVMTFRTSHNAISGERVLEEGGLAVKVMPKPMALGAGCGICLRVDGNDLAQARELLATAGIAPQGCYEKRMTAEQIEYVAVSGSGIR